LWGILIYFSRTRQPGLPSCTLHFPRKLYTYFLFPLCAQCFTVCSLFNPLKQLV
jgi:hypothetical protein